MKRPVLSYFGAVSDFKPIRSLITIQNDSEVIVERCKRIIECNDIKCSAESHGYIIEIWGTDLTLTSFASGSIAVNGRIQSISIDGKARRGKADK